jgi:hypothetical protein
MEPGHVGVGSWGTQLPPPAAVAAATATAIAIITVAGWVDSTGQLGRVSGPRLRGSDGKQAHAEYRASPTTPKAPNPFHWWRWKQSSARLCCFLL